MRNMNKRELKNRIKELPINLGIGGLALIFSLAGRGAVAVSEILEGPKRGMRRSLKRIEETKDFWDYYDELKNIKQNSARTILWRLQKKGLVKREEGRYRLTSQGLNIVKVFHKEKQRKEFWDGKWRIIMFDIPERKRESRNWLRWQLVSLDYKPLQKSVFIGKQPVAKDFYEEILIRKLDQYLHLMTVSEIDDDEFL